MSEFVRGESARCDPDLCAWLKAWAEFPRRGLTLQTGYVAKALMGLFGSDRFRLAVSADGSAFFDGSIVHNVNGIVGQPRLPRYVRFVRAPDLRAGALAAQARNGCEPCGTAAAGGALTQRRRGGRAADHGAGGGATGLRLATDRSDPEPPARGRGDWRP